MTLFAWRITEWTRLLLCEFLFASVSLLFEMSPIACDSPIHKAIVASSCSRAPPLFIIVQLRWLISVVICVPSSYRSTSVRFLTPTFVGRKEVHLLKLKSRSRQSLKNNFQKSTISKVIDFFYSENVSLIFFNFVQDFKQSKHDFYAFGLLRQIIPA